MTRRPNSQNAPKHPRTRIDRLGAVAGGHFASKARPSAMAANRRGHPAGRRPLVFFATKDGGFEGVATFAESGTSLPTVVAIRLQRRNRLHHRRRPRPAALRRHHGQGHRSRSRRTGKPGYHRKGGIVGHAILALGAISLLIAIFKVWEVSRIRVPSRSTHQPILDDLLGGRRAAIQGRQNHPGPAGALVRTGVGTLP
jgi:biopolymer transport protein ExbB